MVLVPGTGAAVYRKCVNIGIEIIDASALALPRVGGRGQGQPDAFVAQIRDLEQRLGAFPDGGTCTVVAERAVGGGESVKTTEAPLTAYIDAGYTQIYGALGMLPPPELAGPQLLLHPESLGHAVARYLMTQALARTGRRPNATVHLVEIDGALRPDQTLEVHQLVGASDLALVATHAPTGQIANGMSAAREVTERQIQALLAALLAG